MSPCFRARVRYSCSWPPPSATRHSPSSPCCRGELSSRSHIIQHLALVKMTWLTLSPDTTGTPSLWSPPSSAATCPSPRWGSVNILAVKCSQHSKLGKYFKQWNGNRHFFMFSDYERSGDSVAVFRAETKNHRCASHPSHRGAESGKTYNQNIFPWAR